MQQRQLVGRVTPPPKPALPVDANGKVIDPVRPRCGAHSKRSGKPCRNWAMPNGRCRMHGGTSTGPTAAGRAKISEINKGNKNAENLGLYADGMHPHEQDIYGMVAVGDLQHEIRMTRLMLKRAYRAQFIWEAVRGQIARTREHGIKEAMLESGLWDIDELVTETGTTGFDKDGIPQDIDKQRVVRRKTDFNAEIRQYAKLLDRLENTQRQLLEGASDADLVARLAEDLRAFNDNAVGTLPGGEI